MKNNNYTNTSDELLEQAVALRLARLRTIPVDTGPLQRQLRAHIPEPGRTTADRWFRLQPVRAVAASFLVIGALVAALVLSTSSGPALASPARMAEVHAELVAGQLPAVRVDSIEAANRVLSGQWPQSPEVPGAPSEHVMACCMKSLKDKKLACVLMERDGVPVSLVVAHSRDMRAPTAPARERNGVRYHVQASGKLNMVMTGREGRWICLIGELPAERLMDVAEQLGF